MRLDDVTVRRVDFGYFVRPGDETVAGESRVEPLLGYLVEHPSGRLLVDTGIGEHPDVDAHYQPRRVPLSVALAAVDATVEDIDVVVNCHLHMDHCGGNPAFAGRPIFVQAVELTEARGENYTLPELVDAPGLVYEELTGAAEIWPGVSIVPTPGHTAGHQSVVVRSRDGSITVIAGQSHDTASDYSADALAVRAHQETADVTVRLPPEWVAYLQRLDPRRVYFAHDHAIWTPS